MPASCSQPLTRSVARGVPKIAAAGESSFARMGRGDEISLRPIALSLCDRARQRVIRLYLFTYLPGAPFLNVYIMYGTSDVSNMGGG